MLAAFSCPVYTCLSWAPLVETLVTLYGPSHFGSNLGATPDMLRTWFSLSTKSPVVISPDNPMVLIVIFRRPFLSLHFASQCRLVQARHYLIQMAAVPSLGRFDSQSFDRIERKARFTTGVQQKRCESSCRIGCASVNKHCQQPSPLPDHAPKTIAAMPHLATCAVSLKVSLLIRLR